MPRSLAPAVVPLLALLPACAGERPNAEAPPLERPDAPLALEDVARGLPEGAAAIGLRRVSRLVAAPSANAASRGKDADDAFEAFVTTRDGRTRSVELASAEQVEAAARLWRALLVRADARAGEERAAGVALRRLVLDPCLALLGPDEAKRLFVFPDGVLHELPLEALPLDEAALRVGDRHRVVYEQSAARLARVGRGAADAPPTGEGALVLGAPDFDAVAAAGGESEARFAPLPDDEARDVARRWGRRAEGDARLLVGADATKEALRQGVVGRRFVHVATRGWFGADRPEPASVERDEGEPGRRPSRASELVRGLAPRLLCGLALAGANAGVDAGGVLTAEELAGFDLAGCELVVLSAGDSALGVRRAGQGVQSLQTAALDAGARACLAALWDVEDASARALMSAFYEELWLRGASAADALWAAQRRLRDAGRPPAEWAGWRLLADTGR